MRKTLDLRLLDRIPNFLNVVAYRLSCRQFPGSRHGTAIAEHSLSLVWSNSVWPAASVMGGLVVTLEEKRRSGRCLEE